MTKKMIDVSSNNHTAGEQLPWAAIKKLGYAAVMIKATEGADYVNPYLKADSAGAHEAGLEIGYYHFAHPGIDTAKTECNHFWQTVKDLPRSLGLSLDLEVTEGKSWSALEAWGEIFLATIPTEVVQRTLYTNPSFSDNLGTLPSHYPLWMASWGLQPRRKVWAWQVGQTLIAGMPTVTDTSILYV